MSRVAMYRDLLRIGGRALGRRPVSQAALAAIESARLQDLVRYATRCSPFYRALFADLGLAPSDIRTASDLARLPVLDKHVARARMAEIASVDVDLATCMRRHTNGTTGTPLAIPETLFENRLSSTLWGRCYTDAGFSAWQRQTKIALPLRIPRRRYLAQSAGLFRRDYIDCTITPAAKVLALRSHPPDALVCWATVLDEISFYLENAGEFLAIPRVFSTGNTLWPNVRERAEWRLHTTVIDLYGAAETGPIAWECDRHCGFHVHNDGVIVELLDDNGRPAQSGRIVCTVLWRRAFPLIRYAIGDAGEWAAERCPCGRPYPLLKGLTGRPLDLVELPDGTRINSVALRAAVFDKPGVNQYQLVEESVGQFRLRVVPGTAFTAQVEQSILDEFRRMFGGALGLRIVKVRRIQAPPGIKPAAMVALPYIARLKASGVDTHTLEVDDL